jgi:hypothetical protein
MPGGHLGHLGHLEYICIYISIILYSYTTILNVPVFLTVPVIPANTVLLPAAVSYLLDALGRKSSNALIPLALAFP